MQIYEDRLRGIKISARSITIGEHVEFGRNIDIDIWGDFFIGDRSRLGDDAQIRGNNIRFGEDLFNSRGLRIGGGGRDNPNANFQIGDRCTIHNNFLNVCEPIIIGHDVGLSPDVSILTHGYWMSVLDGYPASFSRVTIGDSVIIGYRSLIMMGLEIKNKIVVGAQSVVTKSLSEPGIYGGSPARFIKAITPLGHQDRIEKIQEIINKYQQIAEHHSVKALIQLRYPSIYINNFSLDVETFEFSGEEDANTDDFRDYLRKFGIRIYTSRPFRSKSRDSL